MKGVLRKLAFWSRIPTPDRAALHYVCCGVDAGHPMECWALVHLTGAEVRQIRGSNNGARMVLSAKRPGTCWPVTYVDAVVPVPESTTDEVLRELFEHRPDITGKQLQRLLESYERTAKEIACSY